MISRRGFECSALLCLFPEIAFSQHAAVQGEVPPGTVWLNANENPDGPPEQAKEALVRAVAEAGRYNHRVFPSFDARPDAAPGVYSVAFELSGFQTSVRTDVHLTTGSAGRVDAVMKIGALSETVQVSGHSPVVDTVTAAGQTTLMQDQLRTIPMGGTMQEMLPLAAGLSLQAKPDVGDSNLASRSAIIT